MHERRSLAPLVPSVDFSAMDSKQFAEYKEKIRKANAQGKRVIF